MLRDDIFQKKPGDYREEVKLALKDIERVVDFQKRKCHEDKQEGSIDEENETGIHTTMGEEEEKKLPIQPS